MFPFSSDPPPKNPSVTLPPTDPAPADAVVRESPDPAAAANAPDPSSFILHREAKRGRPRLLDEEKRTIVITMLAVGCSQRRAAKYAGVSEGVIRYAARHDPAFAAALDKAKIATEYECMTHLRQHSARSWRASVWCLERVFPERYNLRPRGKAPPPPRPPLGQLVLDEYENNRFRPTEPIDEDFDEELDEEPKKPRRLKPPKKRRTKTPQTKTAHRKKPPTHHRPKKRTKLRD